VRRISCTRISPIRTKEFDLGQEHPAGGVEDRPAESRHDVRGGQPALDCAQGEIRQFKLTAGEDPDLQSERGNQCEPERPDRDQQEAGGECAQREPQGSQQVHRGGGGPAAQ
jgi:hypothetical protein